MIRITKLKMSVLLQISQLRISVTVPKSYCWHCIVLMHLVMTLPSLHRQGGPGCIHRQPSPSTGRPQDLLPGQSQPLLCDWHHSSPAAAAWAATWTLLFSLLTNRAKGTSRRNAGYPHQPCWHHLRICCPSALWLCNPLRCTTHHTSLHHTRHHPTPLRGWGW